MEAQVKDQKQDGRRTSPIRGGKGRNKPGAGKRGGNGGDSRDAKENDQRNRDNQRLRGNRQDEREGTPETSLFLEFENVAEQRIRQVIEEEMGQAEQRILDRLTGRNETRAREQESQAA